jgi:IS605 OrfB family transposase
MHKTIAIKLNQLNNEKHQFIDVIYRDVQLMTVDMLAAKLNLLETKGNFKGHGCDFKHLSPGTAIVQQTERYIDAKLKGWQTWSKKRKRKLKPPRLVNTPIILRVDCFHFEQSKTSSHFNYWLKFRRKSFPIKLSEHHEREVKRSTSVAGSQIIKRDNTFYLQLVLNFATPESPEPRKSLGVDIGILKPIYCSDGANFGSGKMIKHLKLEYSKLRARQQSSKDEISRKQARWTHDVNHKLARQLINHALEHGYNHIVLEKLQGHHLSNPKRRRYSWAFAELQSFIHYKAVAAGIAVTYINPKYTSQTCSKCGTRDKRFRASQSKFNCDCGFKTNADYNAALNIRNFSVPHELNVNQASAVASRGQHASLNVKVLEHEDTTL